MVVVVVVVVERPNLSLGRLRHETIGVNEKREGPEPVTLTIALSSRSSLALSLEFGSALS